MLLFAILLLLIFYSFYWKRRNLPPGPIPLPILGNLHSLYSDPPGYSLFDTWKQRFGPVYTVWYGETPVVTVSDYSAIKSSMIQNGEKYSDRPEAAEFMMYFRGGSNLGIFDASGAAWREQRRFALHVLRDFGMGKHLMEQRILIEVEALVERLKHKGEIKIQTEFDRAVGSVVSSVLLGVRFDEHNEHDFRAMKTHLEKIVENFGKPTILIMLFAAWLRHLPVFKTDFNDLIDAKDGILAICKSYVEKIKETINYDEEDSQTFAEAYLKEQKRRENLGDFSFTDDQFYNVLLDMWMAGLESTSNTLAFAVVYLLNYPETLKKCQEELDNKIEKGATIKLSDRANLSYINATIAEVQRLSNLLVINMARQTTDEVIIGGFTLPKGTLITPQICSVLYDAKIFPDPYTFKPERFLDSSDTFKKVEQLIPFSIGKRSCVGESLAQMELFLFITNILHKFEFIVARPPSMEKELNATMKPKQFICEIRIRE